MRHRGPSKIRRRLADEAARLMYEESVSQYFVAKRMAQKRLFGHGGQRRLRFRPRDLPSNGEIQAALLAMAELREGDRRLARLREMRCLALEVMERLADFEPRLIGSVATGHIRAGSDIDVQLFAEDRDAPEDRLRALGIPYEPERVLIRRPGGFVEYLHLHLALAHPVELTVYDRQELRHRPRSSTNGQPIERVSIKALSRLIEATLLEGRPMGFTPAGGGGGAPSKRDGPLDSRLLERAEEGSDVSM